MWNFLIVSMWAAGLRASVKRIWKWLFSAWALLLHVIMKLVLVCIKKWLVIIHGCISSLPNEQSKEWYRDNCHKNGLCAFYLTSVSFLIFHFAKENRFSSCLLEMNENLMWYSFVPQGGFCALLGSWWTWRYHPSFLALLKSTKDINYINV